MRLRRGFPLIGGLCALVISACSTTGGAPQNPGLPPTPPPVIEPAPDAPSESDETLSLPGPEIAVPDIVDVTPELSGFELLTGWPDLDALPALKAYRRACAIWSARDPQTVLHKDKAMYGALGDWESACFAADYAPDSPQGARRFFEQYFLPVTLNAYDAGHSDAEGLLTGYYEPQIPVRARPDAVYSEPILAKPADLKSQNLPRAKISAQTAPIIAYGRPIDVFFMQVQGSGRIAFEDGRILRAAFAGHNNHKYVSIGGVLIRRGALTREQASKQSIERWMAQNGPEATRALMHENPRYIFFQVQNILEGEGPKGSMGAPLEAMGTMAVDPAHMPYGAMVFIETTLPQRGGDYLGAPSHILVSAQDSGGAIKGALRGDLYFGAGAEAGAKAGVMKHKARWTVLLPAALAIRYLAIS